MNLKQIEANRRKRQWTVDTFTSITRVWLVVILPILLHASPLCRYWILFASVIPIGRTIVLAIREHRANTTDKQCHDDCWSEIYSIAQSLTRDVGVDQWQRKLDRLEVLLSPFAADDPAVMKVVQIMKRQRAAWHPAVAETISQHTSHLWVMQAAKLRLITG